MNQSEASAESSTYISTSAEESDSDEEEKV